MAFVKVRCDFIVVLLTTGNDYNIYILSFGVIRSMNYIYLHLDMIKEKTSCLISIVFGWQEVSEIFRIENIFW